MSYPYPTLNTVNVPCSNDGLEGPAADSTGNPSGASQSPQRVFSRRPEQDILGHNFLQTPPFTRIFSSLTLPQPTAFNADRYHRQHVQSDDEQTRSDFSIILPPIIGLSDCDSPPIDRSLTSNQTAAQDTHENKPSDAPYSADNDAYLRRQLGWKEDTPVNLESLADPQPDHKPPYTLPVLVKLAIQGSKKKKLTLEGIYQALEARFEYFRSEKSAWKRSIRHNLSLNKVFKKTPRPITEAGRGDYWELDFSQGEGYKRERKRKKKGPSAEEETENTARQLEASAKERTLPSARLKSPGQQGGSIHGPVRHATSQSRFSPYPVGEHSSRAPPPAWVHSSPNDYAINASRTEIGVLGYDEAWHAQQASSSTQTHHSVTPYPYSTPFSSGPVVPSPFVSGRGTEQLASTAATSSLHSQFGSGRLVLPPLDVLGAAGGSRYPPFNQWELDEVQGVHLHHGRSWGDCQDRHR